ncbi:MAG: hypothetical protein R2783_00065 [Gelidibacter sp.]
MKLRKPSIETAILMVIYGLVFLYFIFQETIFSPDSYGYLLAMPQRNPGYVVFSKFFEFLFPQNYARVIVGAQLVLGLVAVHVFMKRMSGLLHLNHVLKGVVLTVLLFPFFPPLLIANNICSEGLAYPLYLLFLATGFEFLYNEKKYTLLSISVLYILLTLTRGQFVVTSVIFAMVYFLKYQSSILNKKHLSRWLVILLVPLIAGFADKTYHKLKDGLYISTPYAFVNMSGAAFYVSNENDVDFIETNEYKTLFSTCYKQLSDKKLLMSSKKREGYDAYYQHFHNHVPQICNQTVHDISRGYYYAKFLETHTDERAASVFSLWQSELACKSIFFTLVNRNFKQWSLLYCSNIVHGFKSVVLLIFVIFVFLFSCYGVLSKKHIYYEILFVCSALTLSNAMIVSLASHSIMRYLFYNYVLIFFMVLILFKLLSNAKRS